MRLFHVVRRVLGFGFGLGWALTGNLLFAVVVGGVWILLAGFIVVSALLLAWPLLLAAVAAYWLASLRGWPPRRLLGVAAWSLPMLVVFVGAFGIMWYFEPGADRSETVAAMALAPFVAVVQSRAAVEQGAFFDAAVYLAPVGIPVGLFVGWLAWRSRIGLMEAGLAGWSPASPMVFDYKQWVRASRTARQRVRAPGGVPMLTRRGNPVIGAVIRSVYVLPRQVLELGYKSLRNHILIVGTTGAGKSTLMLRLWAGFWESASRWHAKGREHRPLLVVIDAKGGFDGRDTAERALDVMTDLGAGKVGMWPDEVSLNLWALPPARLTEVLVDLVPVAKEGAAAYYADILAATVHLAVHAPAGPPTSSADFLSRLDPGWLDMAYVGIPERLTEVQGAAKSIPDVRLRYKTLLDRLGPGFDGNPTNPGTDDSITDYDVLYCVVEGTAGTTVAEAQARALVALITDAATRWGREDIESGTGNGLEKRAALLALDEFSAVSGKVRIYELTERLRSLGAAVQIGAQSWESLAPTEDERQRIAATAAGGVFVMRSPSPQKLCELAGTQMVVETGKKIIGGGFGDEGTARLQHAWVLDPDRVRNFAVGQAAYIYGNSATYLHVAPVRRAPATAAADPVPNDLPSLPTHDPEPVAVPTTHVDPPSPPEPQRPQPQRPDGLDDVFGPGGPR
ncbi:helicase HerA domain-containing protein [Tenggerimyces flavus]|uniref:Helicase HerA domain-containing protein n=1 Tax=Tenggerimyces flavus TaxID=1708749 RepID=A0ABV7YK48_9ACTN|nr:DUF87 domain-containing protein [Tenggerimyces flavus]MBM7784896.1 hypothetical protein [Tenggerimyces flavus]